MFSLLSAVLNDGPRFFFFPTVCRPICRRSVEQSVRSVKTAVRFRRDLHQPDYRGPAESSLCGRRSVILSATRKPKRAILFRNDNYNNYHFIHTVLDALAGFGDGRQLFSTFKRFSPACFQFKTCGV